MHYTEGIDTVLGPSQPMCFLVASKEAPYLCQPFIIDIGSRELARAEYEQLVIDYKAWVAAGSQATGWKKLEHINVWL